MHEFLRRKYKLKRLKKSEFLSEYEVTIRNMKHYRFLTREEILG